MVAVEKEVLVTLQFPDVDALNPPILVLNEIDFKYNDQKVIFHQMNLNANLQSRICIVSPKIIHILKQLNKTKNLFNRLVKMELVKQHC